MNDNQLLKLNKAKNAISYLDAMAVILLSFLSSTSGRFVLMVALAISNGYIGSIGFADLFKSRFVQLVLSKSPQLAEMAAQAVAHGKAHNAGIAIMLALDLCIFIFGFAKGKRYKDEFGDDRILNLEPASRAMAILSAVVGGVGFVMVLGDKLFTGSLEGILQTFFGGLFSCIAPILLFKLTHYMKVMDDENISVVLRVVKTKFESIMAEQ